MSRGYSNETPQTPVQDNLLDLFGDMNIGSTTRATTTASHDFNAFASPLVNTTMVPPSATSQPQSDQQQQLQLPPQPPLPHQPNGQVTAQRQVQIVPQQQQAIPPQHTRLQLNPGPPQHFQGQPLPQTQQHPPFPQQHALGHPPPAVNYGQLSGPTAGNPQNQPASYAFASSSVNGQSASVPQSFGAPGMAFDPFARK